MNYDVLFVNSVILLVLLAAMILLAVADRNRCDYDERQRRVQGMAYKAAFFTQALVTVALSAAQEVCGHAWFNMLSLILVGLILSIGVFAVICVCGDAYAAIHQRPGSIYLSFGLLIVAQLLPLTSQPLELMMQGKFTPTAMRLLVVAVLLVILIVYTAKRILERRQGAQE